MISRKKIFPLFYCSHLLIYTFCEVLFVLSLLNSHVWTIVSATRALPLAFPGPLPFPEGIDNYYLLFSALIFGISYLYVYLFFPIFKSQHNIFSSKKPNCVAQYLVVVASKIQVAKLFFLIQKYYSFVTICMKCVL